MGIILNFLLSQAILLPIAVGLLRLRRLGRNYGTFYVLLLLGLLSEVISLLAIKIYHTNAVVIKIYSLFECLLLLYQLYQWQHSRGYKNLFVLVAVISTLFWLTENIAFMNIDSFSPYFRVFYAFMIVLFSINQVNSMMFNDNIVLLKDPRFILSLGFIIFFLYQIIYEASYFVGSDKSAIANKIITGFGYLNFSINLLYSLALYYIPGNNENKKGLYFNDLVS